MLWPNDRRALRHPGFMAGRRHRRNRRAPAETAGRAGPQIPVWNELGGYRLLRTIGRGGTGITYLATADGTHVVVKVFENGTPAERITNEVTALAAIDSPHVVGVVDVSAEPEGPLSLVLERLSSQTLADWLRQRGILDTGEVITAAVSTVRAVRAVHSAGFVHGRVSAGHIRFAAGGCPVLLGFGHAAPATAAGLADDWERCVAVVDAVLARAETVEPEEAHRILAMMQRLGRTAAAGEEAGAVDEVERALFALGPPAPLVLAREGMAGEGTAGEQPDGPLPSSPSLLHSATPHSAARVATSPAAEPSADGTTRRPPRSSFVRAVEFVSHVMEHGVGNMVARRVRGMVAGRMRTVLVGASIATALIVVALFAMPSTPAGHAEAPARSSRPQPSTAHRASDDRSVSKATSTTERTAAAAEDPVHAAFRLLGDRQSCLEHGESGCLAAIDQADSPLLAADRALSSGGRSPASAPLLSQLTLTETIGDAAVISIAPAPGTTKPASVLLIRTEAGWRLRALFEN